MSKLHLAPNLSLPVDAVTQAIGILAKRRAGKSYTARRFAEQLYKAGQQIVIVDPKGDWWGIRSSADGKGPGLPVVILGGERGDVPLEVGAGEVVAKLVAEERVSVLLDLSLFRKHEVATFMIAFLETLYRLKAREAFRTPLMLIIDEADAIMPQKPQENEARMLGAGEDMVRRGGQRGIGCMLITQRSAVLNKNVLTQVEVMVALRTIAPQDLKAMDAWIEVHGEPGQRETLLSSLPALPVGDAWFWSPGWPTTSGIFQRVHVLPIETFDSGASPKAGEKRIEPKNLADVDLGALTKQMAATIEKAKANDPKLLRQRIAELERATKSAPAKTVEKLVADERAIDRAVADAQRATNARITNLREALEAAMKFIINVSTQNFDVAGVDKAELERAITAAVGKASQLIDQRLDARARSIEQLRKQAVEIVGKLKAALGDEEVVIQVDVAKNAPFTVTTPAPPREPQRAPRATMASVEGVSPSMQKVLDAAAALERLGIRPAKRINVAFFAGYTENGHFNNMIGELRTKGLLDYPTGGMVELTDAGRSAARAESNPIASLDDLHGMWLSKVSPSEGKLLSVLIAQYPKAVSRADLAEAAGYTENGHFNNMVGHLSTLGAARYPTRGMVAASEVLFPEGLD